MSILCILKWNLHQTKSNVHMFPEIDSKTSQLPRNISIPLPFIHWLQRVTGVAFVWNVFGANLSVSPWRNITESVGWYWIWLAAILFAGKYSIRQIFKYVCSRAMEIFFNPTAVVKLKISFQWKQLDLIDFQTVWGPWLPLSGTKPLLTGKVHLPFVRD